MAKVLHVVTVLIIASSILQEISPESTNSTTVQPTTHFINQNTTETHHPSSTSMSTHSALSSKSTSSETSALTSINSTALETSTHLTATSSPSHTLSHGTMTTTDQTKIVLEVSKSSETTAVRTTNLTSVTSILSSTKNPNMTAVSTGKLTTTPSSASSNTGDGSLARNPGLVAILCIFFIILALVIVVVIAKIINCQKSSQFERLDDVPMNKMNEDAPFAQYPPN